MRTIVKQYEEEYDGNTSNWVWQSPFEEYKRALRNPGDNDSNMEYTRVAARQRTGTLGRPVTYDREALSEAQDYL